MTHRRYAWFSVFFRVWIEDTKIENNASYKYLQQDFLYYFTVALILNSQKLKVRYKYHVN
jgi:hypothetical protein